MNNYRNYSAGLTASLLLLASSPAMADRGGGAGGADPSGATRATSGRETAAKVAQPSDTATKTETSQPASEGTGVGSDSDRQESSPEHRRSETAGASKPGSAQDAPETTGGGQ